MNGKVVTWNVGGRKAKFLSIFYVIGSWTTLTFSQLSISNKCGDLVVIISLFFAYSIVKQGVSPIISIDSIDSLYVKRLLSSSFSLNLTIQWKFPFSWFCSIKPWSNTDLDFNPLVSSALIYVEPIKPYSWWLLWFAVILWCWIDLTSRLDISAQEIYFKHFKVASCRWMCDLWKAKISSSLVIWQEKS